MRSQTGLLSVLLSDVTSWDPENDLDMFTLNEDNGRFGQSFLEYFSSGSIDEIRSQIEEFKLGIHGTYQLEGNGYIKPNQRKYKTLESFDAQVFQVITPDGHCLETTSIAEYGGWKKAYTLPDEGGADTEVSATDGHIGTKSIMKGLAVGKIYIPETASSSSQSRAATREELQFATMMAVDSIKHEFLWDILEAAYKQKVPLKNTKTVVKVVAEDGTVSMKDVWQDGLLKFVHKKLDDMEIESMMGDPEAEVDDKFLLIPEEEAALENLYGLALSQGIDRLWEVVDECATGYTAEGDEIEFSNQYFTRTTVGDAELGRDPWATDHNGIKRGFSLSDQLEPGETERLKEESLGSVDCSAFDVYGSKEDADGRVELSGWTDHFEAQKFQSTRKYKEVLDKLDKNLMKKTGPLKTDFIMACLKRIDDLSAQEVVTFGSLYKTENVELSEAPLWHFKKVVLVNYNDTWFIITEDTESSKRSLKKFTGRVFGEQKVTCQGSNVLTNERALDTRLCFVNWLMERNKMGFPEACELVFSYRPAGKLVTTKDGTTLAYLPTGNSGNTVPNCVTQSEMIRVKKELSRKACAKCTEVYKGRYVVDVEVTPEVAKQYTSFLFLRNEAVTDARLFLKERLLDNLEIYKARPTA